MRRERSNGPTNEDSAGTSSLPRRRDASLWASEERLRLLIEGVKDCAIFMLDPEGRIAFWNQGPERLYGYCETEVIGRHFACLYPPEEAQAGRPARNLQAAAQGNFQDEGWRLRKDGSRFWAEVIITPVQNKTGDLLGFAKVTRDVSRRNQAEQALRASEERYRRIVETAAEGIWLLDQDWKTILVNGRMAHILHCQPDEMIGRHLSEFMDEEGRQFVSRFRNPRENGFCEWQDFKFIRRDGTPVWTRVTTNTVTTARGEVLGALAMVTDITQREKAEAALREAHQRLQTIIQAAPLAILTTDAAGQILSWNAGAEHIFDWSEKEVVGKECPTVPPEGLEDYRAMIARVMHGETVTGLVRYRQKRDGTLIHANISAAPLRNDAGAIAGAVLILEDFSERQRAEEELRESRQQLRALSAHLENLREVERTRISREIHDELGQMLTGIKMNLRWMQDRLDDFGDDPRVNPILDKLVDTAELTDTTVEMVQRIAAELRPGILDKLGLAMALQYELTQFEGRTGLSCKLTVPDEEPALSPEAATAFFRIFQEALTNVARHADATAIEVNLHSEADCCRLEIHDNGKGLIGVDLHNLKSLGLLGMQERARLLGGDVSFAPRSGGGTVVLVQIPSRPPSQETP